jgi:tRNA modification GTPase
LVADTIAAISTAPGRGAIAVVRLSGPKSVEIVDGLFEGKEKLSASRSHSVRHGRLKDRAGSVIDEVLVTVMRAPDTYTGEDVVEISCHGGEVVSRLVLEATLESGCRLAEAGEFTKRAFLNDRMDLAQAEAVAELVAAKTRRAARQAFLRLEGALSEQIHNVRAEIVEVLSELEARIDFPEDVPDKLEIRFLIERLERCSSSLAGLVSDSASAALLEVGARIPIIGRPNVGKSSLLNAIVGRSRAIVTSKPGTTRDSIEQGIDVEGFPVVLVDTAGLRSATEEIEEEGVRRSREQVKLADLVVFVVDASGDEFGGDVGILRTLGERPCTVVINKIDIADAARARRALSSLVAADGRALLELSAKEGTGVDKLRSHIAARLGSGEFDLRDVASAGKRHLDCLRSSREGIDEARLALEEGGFVELVAFELREAVEALDSVTGQRVGPDILESIFSRFCVGK